VNFLQHGGRAVASMTILAVALNGLPSLSRPSTPVMYPFSAMSLSRHPEPELRPKALAS